MFPKFARFHRTSHDYGAFLHFLYQILRPDTPPTTMLRGEFLASVRLETPPSTGPRTGIWLRPLAFFPGSYFAESVLRLSILLLNCVFLFSLDQFLRLSSQPTTPSLSSDGFYNLRVILWGFLVGVIGVSPVLLGLPATTIFLNSLGQFD